jgi:2-iminobutanoate/2-iminopropanoate deaminase
VRHIVLPGDEGFPFSQAVLDDDLLFVAGQLAADDAGWVGPATIETETKTALKRIGRILDAAGASFADVMKVGVFMVDLGQFEAMNAVYRTFFPDGRLPARTCVGVASLLGNALIEIDCVARVRRDA